MTDEITPARLRELAKICDPPVDHINLSLAAPDIAAALRAAADQAEASPSVAEYVSVREADWARSQGWHDFDVEGYRRALERINPEGRKLVVGKHTVGVHHVSNVIAAADHAGLYMVADTLRWMMWHEVVRDNRERLVQGDLQDQVAKLTATLAAREALLRRAQPAISFAIDRAGAWSMDETTAWLALKAEIAAALKETDQ